MTARWVVDEVAPHRDLQVVWQPISLLFKNDPEPGSDYHQRTMVGHRMLRVMEAVRAESGDAAVFDWYWRCATSIHHDHRRDGDLGDLLEQIGLDRALAAAADDERWDVEIRARMEAGLALTGDDVGTPIIAWRSPTGEARGIFGPVITEVPDTEQSLRLWDATETLALMDGFWELKRIRTERPRFGDRPDV